MRILRCSNSASVALVVLSSTEITGLSGFFSSILRRPPNFWRPAIAGGFYFPISKAPAAEPLPGELMSKPIASTAINCRFIKIPWAIAPASGDFVHGKPLLGGHTSPFIVPPQVNIMNG